MIRFLSENFHINFVSENIGFDIAVEIYESLKHLRKLQHIQRTSNLLHLLLGNFCIDLCCLQIRMS